MTTKKYYLFGILIFKIEINENKNTVCIVRAKDLQESLEKEQNIG